MKEIVRGIFVLSQFVAWLISQLLRLCFASEMHRPPDLFEQGPERCLILAPTHKSVLDPFLIMSALRYRHWREIVPVRTLATETFRRFPLTWLTSFIRALYRIAGVIELPPKEEGGSLPEKVKGLLGAHYVSSNYTHVVRDILDAGINVLAQLVAKTPEDGDALSLSCNPDLTLDLAPRMREAERGGEKIALLAQVNRHLPFMYGDAAVQPDYFDAVVDERKYNFPLFAPPNPPVGTADYLIALYVSALIRDGGTLQLGIGSLGDAVTYLLKLRQEDNATYRSLLLDAGVLTRFGEVIERVGGIGPFDEGLYAATEMLVHGFLELDRCGVLKRTVQGNYVAHACFFLGPGRFYEALRTMHRCEREQFSMTGISFVNQLYGQEELKRLQRKDARFINTGLIATLSGAVNSDALEDGRVVSGVGGQYNFVTMAHALEDGRSILLIRSTYEEHGALRSNIRRIYGNITIPRHLRDIVVTEYGIADVRGRTAEDVATALVEIADSRFQEELLQEAQQAGTIASRYRIPDWCRRNRLERFDAVLAPYRARGLFPQFPFGTDLTDEEVVLKKAFESLKRIIERKRVRRPRTAILRKIIDIPEGARPYLERMKLDAPQTFKERLEQRAMPSPPWTRSRNAWP